MKPAAAVKARAGNRAGAAVLGGAVATVVISFAPFGWTPDPAAAAGTATIFGYLCSFLPSPD